MTFTTHDVQAIGYLALIWLTLCAWGLFDVVYKIANWKRGR